MEQVSTFTKMTAHFHIKVVEGTPSDEISKIGKYKSHSDKM